VIASNSNIPESFRGRPPENVQTPNIRPGTHTCSRMLLVVGALIRFKIETVRAKQDSLSA
jgi:hypothetical protein